MKKIIGFLACIALVFIGGMIFNDFAGVSMAVAPFAAVADRNRQIYKTVKQQVGTLIPNPAYLRVEQSLSNSKALYSFDVKKNGNEIATEIKLDRNDLFVVHSLAIFISAQVSSSIGAEVLQTYPNKVVFGTNSGFTYTHLEAVYNGYLRLKVANMVNIDNMPLLHFRHVPMTQQIAAVSSGSSATATKTQAIDHSEFNLMSRAYPLESLIYLSGTMDINFEINIPTFSSIQIAATAASTTNKLVLMPIGLLVKNGAGKAKI